MNPKLICGDALEQLKLLGDNTIDALVTDPPAGIGFMGKEWDHHKGGRDEWIKWLRSIMEESLRVLKPGGHGLVWALPRTSHWTATALEDAGFEVRDCVYHVFGSGFPKSLNVGKAIDKLQGNEREEYIDEYFLFDVGSPTESEYARFQSIAKSPAAEGDLWLGHTIEDD